MRKLSVPAIALFFFIAACTKIQSTDIGNGIVGPLNSVTTFDTTLDVTTQNFLEENIPRVYKADDNVIGVIKTDPLFGTTTASSYFELKPDFFPYYFTGTDFKIDSIVLSLRWTGIFGDSTIPQTWEVHEVSKKMKWDSSYYTKDQIAYNNTILGSKSVSIVGLYDTVFNKAPIRIKLDNTFGTRLLGYDSSSTTNPPGAYSLDSLFREKFAGFAVVPSATTQGNALISVNLQDTATKLIVYYTSKASATATKRDTLNNSFHFSTGNTTTYASANANRVDRNRAGSQVASYLGTQKIDEVFLQTSPGTIATVKVPGLRSFPNVIIHRAELIAEQDPDNAVYDPIFYAPRYLLLSTYDSVHMYKTNVRNDFLYDPNSGPNVQTFGGFRFQKVIASLGTVAAYNFDLTRYVQGIVTRKDSSYTLRLTAPTNDSLFYTPPYPAIATATGATSMLYLSPAVANNTAFGRVRLGGGTNTRVRMRLRIIYSKI